MKHITIVAGARPNFIKIAPLIHQLNDDKDKNFSYSIIHTGQHFDKNMSESFFEQLKIPSPDFNLGCGGGTQSQQTAKIMIEFEKYLFNTPTDLVIVVGDVTSTLACSITARKCKVKVAHIEAGIRSDDLNMPEEINRIVTDSITNYFFTTSENATQKLLEMGHLKQNIFFVGNIMIDSLKKNLNKLITPSFWNSFNLKINDYLVLTLHRPSNVDKPLKLKSIINEIISNSKNKNIIFPMHPRTRKNWDKLNLNYNNLFIVDPMSYLEFIFLIKNSMGVVTDSGGISEETTVLDIPCMTLRDSTERPETISEGTNELIGTDPKNISPFLSKIIERNWKNGKTPKLWDGFTSSRIISILKTLDL